MVHHTHARTPILSLVTQMLLFKERKKSKKKPLAKWRRRPIFIAVQYSFFIIVIGVVHKILLPLTLDCLNCIQFLCGCFSSNTTIFPSSSSSFFSAFQCCWFFWPFEFPSSNQLCSICVCVRICTYKRGRIESGAKNIRPNRAYTYTLKCLQTISSSFSRAGSEFSSSSPVHSSNAPSDACIFGHCAINRAKRTESTTTTSAAVEAKATGTLAMAASGEQKRF